MRLLSTAQHIAEKRRHRAETQSASSGCHLACDPAFIHNIAKQLPHALQKYPYGVSNALAVVKIVFLALVGYRVLANAT
jgi:hypothetical protein